MAVGGITATVERHCGTLYCICIDGVWRGLSGLHLWAVGMGGG